jgi:ABC-type multidrug transport system fused ATPase/permease subunit
MRELKRLDGTTRSPVYSFFSATLHGLLPIRAYRRGAPLQAAFVGKLQRNATAWYWWLIANRWFGFNLDLLCFIMVSATAFLAVALRDGTEPGLVGLALVYVLALSGMFQYMMRQSALVETYMTSVERISRYCRLESEESVLRRAHGEEKEEGEPEGVEGAVEDGGGGAVSSSELELVVLAAESSEAVPSNGKGSSSSSSSSTSKDNDDTDEGLLEVPDAEVPDEWPARGEIRLEGLRVRYREDLPEVIRDVSAVISAGSKVGVVGRTGSGKSSLLLALSRLNEVCGGRVLIDGVDILRLPLWRLRRAVAVSLLVGGGVE